MHDSNKSIESVIESVEHRPKLNFTIGINSASSKFNLKTVSGFCSLYSVQMVQNSQWQNALKDNGNTSFVRLCVPIWRMALHKKHSHRADINAETTFPNPFASIKNRHKKSMLIHSQNAARNFRAVSAQWTIAANGIYSRSCVQMKHRNQRAITFKSLFFLLVQYFVLHLNIILFYDKAKRYVCDVQHYSSLIILN